MVLTCQKNIIYEIQFYSVDILLYNLSKMIITKSFKEVHSHEINARQCVLWFKKWLHVFI